MEIINLRFSVPLILLLFFTMLSNAQVVRIPFEDHNGTIVLTVKINEFDRPLKLLFDTGADGMAVSQSLADSIGLKVSRTQSASVVGGSVDISVSAGNTVHFGDFDFKDQGIAIFKELYKQGCDGIIGNTLARHYIVKVDYDRMEVLLYDFDGFQENGDLVVPIDQSSGLMVIPGVLSIKPGDAARGNFIFDTGASYSLICFRPFVKKHRLLVSGFKAESNGSTVSMGITTPTFSGKAVSFSFSGLAPVKNIPITLMAGGGQSESWNPGYDGSIGTGLIGKYNFTINLQKKEIHFFPNNKNRNEKI